MTWVAVGGTALNFVQGGKAADKAAEQQFDANILAKNAQRQSAAQMQPWTTRSSNAASELQALLGLGANDSEADLYNRYMGEYTTTVKKKKKKGGFLKRIVDSKTSNSVSARLLGIGAKAPKSNEVVDWAGLEKRVKDEMAKQKATRERSDFGMLKKDFTAADMEKDSGYQFRLGEGEQGVNRSLAARGGIFSGQAGKELARYNQGFASNEFGAAADRYNRNRMNIYNMLAGQASGGAANSLNAAQLGNMGQFAFNQGNIGAANTMAQQNNLTNALNTGMNYWQSNRAMSSQPKTNQAMSPSSGVDGSFNLSSMYRGL